MNAKEQPPGMVKYQFEVDDDDWKQWKKTIPRTKTLDARIRELLRADTEGRVEVPTDLEEGESSESPQGQDSDNTAAQEPPEPADLTDEQRERLRDRLAGSGETLEARVDAISTMYALLREQGSAEKDELLSVVDVDEVGYQDETSTWANLIKGKDTLQSLPGVEPASQTRTEWRYVEE